MSTAIQKRPRFTNGAFLSVRKWHPNFVASTTTETYSAIRSRLPELLTEYDHLILSKIDTKLGKLVKTDLCTSATLRGRYVRICIEVPLDTPVKNHIYIGSLNQQLIYEGADILCIICGMLRHTQTSCLLKNGTNMQTPNTDTVPLPAKHVISKKDILKEDWQVVTFKKINKPHKKT